MNQIKSKKDKYTVIENNNNFSNKNNKYSLDNLPNFNEVLNLFAEKYFYSIKRDKAFVLQLKDLKDEEFYLNNSKDIKRFKNFFNKLELKLTKVNLLIFLWMIIMISVKATKKYMLNLSKNKMKKSSNYYIIKLTKKFSKEIIKIKLISNLLI